MDAQLPLIQVEISEGYCCRALIHFFQLTNTVSRFYFNAQGMLYNQQDAGGLILNILEVSREKCTKYICTLEDDETIIVPVNLANLKTQTTSIGKTDSLIFTVYPDRQRLLIEAKSSKTSSQGQNYVVIEQIEETRPIAPPDEFNGVAPICTVQAKEFSQKCTALSKFKCDKIIVTTTPTGATFLAESATSTAGVMMNIGQPYPQDSGEKMRAPSIPGTKLIVEDENNIIVLLKNYVKALAKLDNISNNGKVLVYTLPNFIKIKTNFGSSGDLYIYLRSHE